MAKGIARQSIGGRTGIGRRPIASRFGQANVGYATNFRRGVTLVFTPPKAGYYLFVGWGAGGGGQPTSGCGGSGAYVEVTRYLTPNQSVSIFVGIGATGGNGSATTFTFQDGSVVSATGGPAFGGGSVAATGPFDFSLNGTAGPADGATGGPGLGTGGGAAPGGANLGSGAPGRLPFRGGDGGGNNFGFAPGAGAGEGGSNTTGADGAALAVFVRS